MNIDKDLIRNFKKRDENANKGDFGRALLICGSYSMLGAAVIAARACILSGVGICDIAMQKEVYPAISLGVPEAVCTPLSSSFSVDDKKLLLKKIKSAKSILIGCGMGKTDYTRKILAFCLEHAKVPIIIDADAINVLAENLSLLELKKSEVIITPHPAEMGRLIGKTAAQVNEDRVKTAVDFSKKYGIITLLKGHNTVISSVSGEYFINKTGNAGMATGGSGDMLSGIIAAFCANSISPFESAKSGAYVHGLSGDICAKEFSQTSTNPSLMLKVLPKIFLEIEKNL